MKPKYLLLLASIFLVSAGARADTVDKDGILRDAQGKVLTMNQENAIKACADQKMRLPTVRELAKISQSMGAKGILEISEVKEGERPADFYLIVAKNPDGSEDRFWFNHDGYKRPEGDLGNYSFWSSSVHLLGWNFGYYLLGDGGDLPDYDRRIGIAVRCVVGQ